MKRILVDINHPAHVHLFKYFIKEMEKAGHEVFVTAKNAKSITDLLKLYQIKYSQVGAKKDNILLKYIFELAHLAQVYSLVVRKKIDYGIGVSIVLPIVSKLTAMKSFALDDDDVAVTPISSRFISYASVILNPDALHYENRGEQQICYPGYHELAYLHPARFKPDRAVLTELGLKQHERFFVLRFNAFKAHHDTGIIGLSLSQKLEIIELLKTYGTVFITTEREIEPELKPYQLPISPEKIHSLLYYASLFIGDSQTMTTEAALLGTPAVKLNSFAGRLSIPNEIEQRYELCYSFLPGDFDDMLTKIQTLLKTENIKTEWAVRRERLLADKMDVTAFLTQFVSNYPASFDEIKRNMAHQYAL